jgi:DNA-binding NtrC family response regulator
MLEGTLIRVLLIEDEEFDVRRVQNTLRPFTNQIAVRDIVADGQTALALLREHREAYDIVIMDFQIAGGLMGEQLIREIKKIDPSVQIIVVTKMTINITDFDFASRLLQAGAFWYCTKYPGDIEDQIYQPTDFILSIFNAYQKQQLEREQTRSKKKLAQSVASVLEQKALIGGSPAIEEVRRQVRKCAESGANVMITGPSGTGKEFVAHNIHFLSSRKYESFVPINCGSIPADLVESELFGYEKGAFTGANARKLGLFEVANHGTIFLDEIAELPHPAQVTLLRVLQDGEIEKIGRTGKIKVDVRIIAATNKDLGSEVEARRFREDLFYRLNVLPISVPPLRDRRADIPEFVRFFLRQISEEIDRQVPDLERGAEDLLVSYDWPGNVRELKNVVQRILFDSGQAVTVAHVETALGRSPAGAVREGEFAIDLRTGGGFLPWRQMERAMREKYFRFVRSHSSSDADAAKKLGLAPPNYHRMCKEMKIK